MSYRIYILLVSCLMIIQGCSSAPTPEKYAGKIRDQLTTDIKQNGLKLFTYRASLNLPSIETQQQSQDYSELRKNVKQLASAIKDFEQQFDLGLAKTMEMTGYCRNGYLELFRLIENGRGELKGECNEGATQEDIIRFGN